MTVPTHAHAHAHDSTAYDGTASARVDALALAVGETLRRALGPLSHGIFREELARAAAVFLAGDAVPAMAPGDIGLDADGRFLAGYAL